MFSHRFNPCFSGSGSVKIYLQITFVKYHTRQLKVKAHAKKIANLLFLKGKNLFGSCLAFGLSVLLYFSQAKNNLFLQGGKEGRLNELPQPIKDKIGVVLG